jgi:hypothetical protein
VLPEEVKMMPLEKLRAEVEETLSLHELSFPDRSGGKICCHCDVYEDLCDARIWATRALKAAEALDEVEHEGCAECESMDIANSALACLTFEEKSEEKG